MGTKNDIERTLRADESSHVIVYVHGFKQRCDVVNRHAGLLVDEGPVTIHQAPATVIAFLWPSHTKHYANAKTDASKAGKRLADLLSCLQRADYTTVSVVTHSLGARVALNALCGEHEQGADAFVRNLIFIGAAVGADALSPRGEFPRGRIQASRVVVFYSANDDVLASGTFLPSVFAVGEAFSGALLGLKALGAVGPAERYSADESYDVSEEVKGHNPSEWLSCARVKDLIQGSCCAKAMRPSLQRKNRVSAAIGALHHG